MFIRRPSAVRCRLSHRESLVKSQLNWATTFDFVFTSPSTLLSCSLFAWEQTAYTHSLSLSPSLCVCVYMCVCMSVCEGGRETRGCDSRSGSPASGCSLQRLGSRVES